MSSSALSSSFVSVSIYSFLFLLVITTLIFFLSDLISLSIINFALLLLIFNVSLLVLLLSLLLSLGYLVGHLLRFEGLIHEGPLGLHFGHLRRFVNGDTHVLKDPRMVHRAVVDKVTYEVLVFKGLSHQYFFLELFFITVHLGVLEFLVASEAVLHIKLEKTIVLFILDQLGFCIIDYKAAFPMKHVVFEVPSKLDIPGAFIVDSRSNLSQ